MIKKIIGLCVFSAFFAGCYYDVESELYTSGCNLPETISFGEDIQPILNTWCAISGCHLQGGTGTGLLDTYEGVIQKLDDGSFENALFVDKDMPPDTPFPTCHSQAIRMWIDQGALNN